MYSSRDKAGHYFSDVRRSIDALYFAYFITRYYPGPSSLRTPPPSFRTPWASLYELTELGGREKKIRRTRIKEKRAGWAKIPEKSERIMEKEREPWEDERRKVQEHLSYADLISPRVSSHICSHIISHTHTHTHFYILNFTFSLPDSNFSELSANYT